MNKDDLAKKKRYDYLEVKKKLATENMKKE